MSEGAGSGGFSLAGVDTSFSSKSADIFGSLAALEKKHENMQETMAKEDQTGLIKDDPELDTFGQKRERKIDRGCESGRDRDRQGYRSSRDFEDRKDKSRDIGNRQQRDSEGFRVPQGRAPRSHHHLPEHKRNPDKFTHYNLADTPETSNRSNSAAAFDFLNSLKKKKEDKCMDLEDDDKIVFRKPVSKDITEEKKSTVGAAGKLVMPEYAVGQKTNLKKAKPKMNASVAGASKINLGHLENEGETDETNQDGGAAVTFKKVNRKGQRRRREEDEEEEIKEHGGGTKRKADEEEEKEEESGSIIRRDRAAERRKKPRAKLYQRQQLADSASEDEEEWEEELRKAREEEKEEGDGKEEEEDEEGIEDMVVEGV